MNLINKIINNKSIFSKGRIKKSYSYISSYYDVSEEQVRECIKKLKSNTFVTEISEKKEVEVSKLSTFINLTTPGVYFITGCVHAPFHNKEMYNSVFNYIRTEIKSLEGIILAGDILDLNSLSSHDRGKVALPNITLDYEYKKGSMFMDQIDLLAKDTNTNTKVFLYGNHEDRYFRALKDIDTSKYGSALKSPSEGLNLSDRGYIIIDDFKSGHINIGNHLEVNHGEFINVHSAKKTIDTYRKSVLYHHTHRFQVYTEGRVGGWNMGWGGDINAPVFNYATRAMKKSWTNGCSIVTLDKDSNYHVQPLLWINNKLIINGKKY